MSTATLMSPAVTDLISTRAQVQPSQWFAVHTRSRHEKKIHAALKNEGLRTFLPLVSKVSKWTDRRVTVQLPLFPCYVFVNLSAAPAERLQVLQTWGVLSFVGIQGRGIPIPDSQIEELQKVADNNVPVDPCAYLKVGQRVRVRGGCLDGIEGILAEKDGERKVVISVDAIEKSLAIHIKGYEVEPV
jgi:transcription antitermination factor NusG